MRGFNTKWSRRTALVTGGAGLVGSRIVRKLVRRGANVKVLDNLSAYPFNQLIHFGVKQDNIEVIIGDVKDETTVRNVVNGVDVVFHEAAFADVAATIWNPTEDFDSNVFGTFNLLTAVREKGVDRLLFASSAAVYGNQSFGEAGTPPVLSEQDKPNPLSTYANSKLWGENECLLFHRLYGLKTTSLRYFSVYGEPQVPKEGSHSWVVAIFAMRARKSKPLVIFGDGTQVRDFIHVDDVAEATILAAESQSTIGEVVNIGTGEPTGIRYLADVMMDVVGKKLELKFRPRLKGDPMGGCAHTSKMKKLLKWEPQIALKDGIRRYWKWLLRNKKSIPEWLGKIG